MGTLDEDVERMVADTKGHISRGELLAALGVAIKIGGEATAALTVAVTLVSAGWFVGAVTAGLGFAITPWILQAVNHLMARYLTLDTDQRRAVATLVGLAQGRIAID